MRHIYRICFFNYYKILIFVQSKTDTMSTEVSTNIVIQKAEKTKISEVDFNNLPFGKFSTDHMLVCDYKDGKWQQLQILPFQNISLDPSAKIFHYGQSVFEGMKA